MEKYSFKKIYQVLVSTVSPWHLSYALFSYPSHPISVLLEALPWRLTVAGEASMTAVLPPHRLRSGANRYLPERTGCWHFSFPPVPHHRSPIPGSHGWLRGRLPSPHPAPTLGIASLRSLWRGLLLVWTRSKLRRVGTAPCHTHQCPFKERIELLEK